MIARIEDDEAALLHEGIDLGERRVGKWARVLAHRPIEEGKEGKLVLLDVDTHGVGGLERGAGAQHLAQSRQSLLAGAVDLRIAGDDIGEPRVQGGLAGEIVGRWGRRIFGGLLCNGGRSQGGPKCCGNEDGDTCGGDPAAETKTAAQHQHGENVSEKEGNGRKIEPRLERHRLLHNVTADRARPFNRADRLEHGLSGDEVQGAGGAGGTVIAGRMIRAGHDAVELVRRQWQRAKRRCGQLAEAIESLERGQRTSCGV